MREWMSAPTSRTNVSKLAWLERTPVSPAVIEQVTNLARSLSSLPTTQGFGLEAGGHQVLEGSRYENGGRFCNEQWPFALPVNISFQSRPSIFPQSRNLIFAACRR